MKSGHRTKVVTESSKTDKGTLLVSKSLPIEKSNSVNSLFSMRNKTYYVSPHERTLFYDRFGARSVDEEIDFIYGQCLSSRIQSSDSFGFGGEVDGQITIDKRFFEDCLKSTEIVGNSVL